MLATMKLLYYTVSVFGVLGLVFILQVLLLVKLLVVVECKNNLYNRVAK